METLTEPAIMATNLGDYLTQYGAPLPSAEALRLFRSIAKIVGEMHDQFAVYGELKIENIILSASEPPTVLDCGIPQSRLTGKQLAPERIAIEAQDDIYQLGVILYRLATGQDPPKRRPTFNFSVDPDLASERPPVPDPRTINPNVSEPIAALVANATAMDLTKRAGKVAELLSVLDSPADVKLDSPAIDLAPGAVRQDAVEREATASAPLRDDAKISLKKRTLPVVSERTGFLVNERELESVKPKPSVVEPKSLVDGIAQAFADISGTGEKPTGVGFKAFLSFFLLLILFVAGLAVYRVVEKLTMADPTAVSQGEQSPLPSQSQPSRQKLSPAPAPADISTELPTLVAVKGGTFAMGGDNGLPDELPIREVTVSDFEIGKYEVTNAQYKAFCDATKRSYPEEPNFEKIPEYMRTSPNYPVVKVSWDDANAYCIWLSERTGNLYRLPTEAEWEYVARDTPIGWDSYNSGGSPHEVGTSPPSKLGVYDLMGNVWEWCNDWYAPYEPGVQTNPKGAPRGTHKVLRGCSWYFSTVACRPSSRFRFEPDLNYWFNGGFRVVRAKR